MTPRAVDDSIDIEALPDWQLTRRGGILDAAATLLSARSYDDIQMRDIADQAEVALGTIYRYFSSKELLYAEVIAAWIADHLDVPPPSAHTAADRLRWRMDVVASAYDGAPHFLGAQQRIQGSANPAVLDCLGASVAASARWLQEDLDVLEPERAADIGPMLWAIMNAMVAHATLLPGAPEQGRRIGDTFVGLIARELEAAESAR